jgi:hypothetical protein
MGRRQVESNLKVNQLIRYCGICASNFQPSISHAKLIWIHQPVDDCFTDSSSRSDKDQLREALCVKQTYSKYTTPFLSMI